MKYFGEGSNREQISLLPPPLEEYVDAEDAARYVDALVEEFDLRQIGAKYSHIGRPAYSPKVLVKLLLYGKLRGMRSSRELARASQSSS